jgi:hypothetical protein
MEERYLTYERSRMAITQVQLLHVDRMLQMQGTRSPEAFLQVLDERTPILSFFKWRWDTHARTVANDPMSVALGRDSFLSGLSEALSTLYANGGATDWHTPMTAFLQEQHEELDRRFGTYEQQYALNTQEWKRVGAIQVAPPQPLDVLFRRYPLLVEELARHRLGADTPAIQIHVPTRFTQGGESPWEPGRTILQLARHLKTIKHEYGRLGMRALFGLSWQFDSVLGRRLGFTVVDSPDLPQNIMGAWYQLLNEDGTFNKKRLAYLLEHNALPYRLKCGFMTMPCQPAGAVEARTPRVRSSRDQTFATVDESRRKSAGASVQSHSTADSRVSVLRVGGSVRAPRRSPARADS